MKNIKVYEVNDEVFYLSPGSLDIRKGKVTRVNVVSAPEGYNEVITIKDLLDTSTVAHNPGQPRNSNLAFSSIEELVQYYTSLFNTMYNVDSPTTDKKVAKRRVPKGPKS